MASSKESPAMLAASLCDQLMKTLKEAKGQLSGDTAQAAVARGKVFQIAKYFEYAEESYKKALSLDPGLDEARARLALVQLFAAKLESGLATATALAQRSPGYELKELTSEQVSSSMTILGEALSCNGRVHDAIEAYKLAQGSSRKDAFAAGRLAQAYLASGNGEAAVAQAGKIGNNPRFRSLIALLTLGQKTAALLPKFSPGDMTTMMANSAQGRPMVVQGTARRASIEWGRTDWC